MGAGASTALGNAIAPNKMKSSRSKAKARQHMKEGCKTMSEELMEKYDVSKTGTLLPDEVKAIAEDLLREATPLVGGVTDEDREMVMRLGGETSQAEIRWGGGRGGDGTRPTHWDGVARPPSARPHTRSQTDGSTHPRAHPHSHHGAPQNRRDSSSAGAAYVAQGGEH